MRRARLRSPAAALVVAVARGNSAAATTELTGQWSPEPLGYHRLEAYDASGARISSVSQ